jgi:hypothetical protein
MEGDRVMRYVFRYCVCLCLLIMSAIPLTALAEWAEDGNFIVVWQDQRVAMHDTYANKIDIHGNVLWAVNGVAICTNGSTQELPEIVADGNGGAIVVWLEQAGGLYDIYARKIEANGVLSWAATICTAAGDVFTRKMVLLK